MYKDILVFMPEHETKSRQIVDSFLERTVSNSYEGIICLHGISGTGKTEIAHLTSERLYGLGISSHVINLDKFYVTDPSVRGKWRRKNNYVGHLEMDWVKINNEIAKFMDHEVRVLIIEGLYAGRINGIKFYLESNVEESDNFRRLRNKENEDDPWRQYVVGEEFSDILEMVGTSDYVI